MTCESVISKQPNSDLQFPLKITLGLWATIAYIFLSLFLWLWERLPLTRKKNRGNLGWRVTIVTIPMNSPIKRKFEFRTNNWKKRPSKEHLKTTGLFRFRLAHLWICLHSHHLGKHSHTGNYGLHVPKKMIYGVVRQLLRCSGYCYVIAWVLSLVECCCWVPYMFRVDFSELLCNF